MQQKCHENSGNFVIASRLKLKLFFLISVSTGRFGSDLLDSKTVATILREKTFKDEGQNRNIHIKIVRVSENLGFISKIGEIGKSPPHPLVEDRGGALRAKRKRNPGRALLSNPKKKDRGGNQGGGAGEMLRPCFPCRPFCCVCCAWRGGASYCAFFRS